MHSSAVALANGMSLPVLFGQLRGLRAAPLALPVRLMSYLNPVLQFGVEKFCEVAAVVDINGLIMDGLALGEY